jgi:D-amino-acid dehydrogenase
MGGSAIVVGAGITGVSAAEWLRRRGWAVTLLDRVPPGDPRQTSFGNAGLLARASIVPVAVPGLIWATPRLLLDPLEPLFLRWTYLPRLLPWLVPFLLNGARSRLEPVIRALVPLTADTVDQHFALARGTPAEAFLRQGEYGFLYADRAAFRADALAFGYKLGHGFRWREAEGPELHAIDPALGPGAGFAAIFPDHGWVTDPGAYLAALASGFAAAGGTVRQAEVAAVRPGGVTLAGGETLAADRIVVAAGVWSKSLAAGLGVRAPLETERGYHLLLKRPSALPPFPMMVAAGRFVMTPMAAGLRLAGIVEFGGTAAGPSEAPLRLIRARLRAVYPDLSWEAEESWMGHRPTLTDSLPMLGESPKAPGVILAFGSQHLGLTIGPRLGRMAADIAAGRRTDIDPAPYAPGRFGR